MITPIEMYTMIPKSHEASHVKQAETAKDASRQAEITQNIENRANEDTQRTVRMTETEDHEYRYDAKERGNNEYHGENKKKDGNGHSEEDGNEQTGRNMSDHPGGIDIRI